MAGELYFVRGTPLLFADTAQTEDVKLTLTALASGAGIVSALYDRGAGAFPALLEVRLHCSLTGTNVPGAAVEIYVFGSDGTNHDGGVTADAAFATAKRNNATLVGQLIVDQATTNVVMWSRPFLVLVPTRYYLVGVWDATTLPFTTSTSAHGVVVTPCWWQSQA